MTREEYIAGVFEEACAALSLEHERIPVHSPNYNAYIESWHAPWERECLAGHEFLTYAEAYTVVTQWITHYNTVRPHGRLHYWAPEQMRQRVARGQDQWVPLKV